MTVEWRPQFDGSPRASDNCGPTTFGRFAKAQLKGEPTTHLGAWRSKIHKRGDGSWRSDRPTMAERIRGWIIVNLQPVGWGTTILQNAQAIKALWGAEIDGYRFNVPWPDAVGYVVAGRKIGLRIIYRHVHAYPHLDGCRTFDGGHLVFVQERRLCMKHDRYEFLVDDSLEDRRFAWIPQGGPRAGHPDGGKWWPAELLRKAATDNGAHGVEFAYTRDLDG